MMNRSGEQGQVDRCRVDDVLQYFVAAPQWRNIRAYLHLVVVVVVVLVGVVVVVVKIATISLYDTRLQRYKVPKPRKISLFLIRYSLMGTSYATSAPCIEVYVYMYVNMISQVCMYVYICICMCVYMYLSKFVCLSLNILYVCMSV